MYLVDLNPGGGIGANAHYVEIGPFKILVDAGLHPARKGLGALPDFSPIADDSLDFILLTHCHLDHLAALPVILRPQSRAEVILSLPSKILAPRMLHNSCSIMKLQRETLQMNELPLYTHGEVEHVRQRFHPLAFGRPRTFHAHGESLEITLFAAGHIPGAAGFLVTYKHRKIFFSGDVLFERQKTLAGARFPDFEVDTLVLESTRGAMEATRAGSHRRQSETDRLIDLIDHVLSHGGSVLIPVFALGRMQEVLAIINDARSSGALRSTPVFSTGLGVDVAHLFDEISRKTGLVNFRKRILKDLRVQAPPEIPNPACPPSQAGLYLLGSGMMVENTPSDRMAASLVQDHQNAVCFVGYCDPETPGGKLLQVESGGTFLFDALDYVAPVHARVERFDLSGHADRDELLNFALKTNPRSLILTHGDADARDWFFDEITYHSPNTTILDPKPLQRYLV
jgi:Cft2 family RNA processing exonuclease